MTCKTRRPLTHRCAGPGCTADVPNKHIMCWAHWKRVPARMQEAIVAEWKYGLTYKCHPTHAYAEALTRAREFLKEQDAQRMAKAQSNSPLLAGGAA